MASNGDTVKAVSSATASTSKQLSKTATSSNKSLDATRKQQNTSPVDGASKKQNTSGTKAWQGPNPIISRANNTSPLTNGVEKSTSKTVVKTSMDPHTEKHAYDRLLFLIASMTGYDATITLKNGEQFKGVLSGGSFEAPTKSFYTLKMVKRTRLPSHQQVNGNVEPLDEYAGEGDDHIASFDIQDTADFAVDNITITTKSNQNGSTKSSFRTDTEISGRAPNSTRERELQKWEPGPSDMSLDDLAIEESGTNGWDQFAANEQKYGVSTTYQEDIYTTAINTSHPQYKKRVADAERLAREIEGSTAANAHVAEERQKDTVEADDGDEEDKYSGVKRDITPLPKGSSGSYIPPSRRPITNQPTVPGAPYDPAIISSQVARPTETKTEEKDEEIITPSPIPAARISPSTTEDRVRDTADAFKQFANNEKLRLRQAQELKRTNARMEKNVKINDLKKFAENFKLKSRVPDDLVPILAKDHEKQVEIKRKADEAARVEEQRAKDPKLLSTSPSTTAVGSDRASVSSQSSRPRVAQSRSQFVPQLTPGMSPRQQQVFNTKPPRQSLPPQQLQNINIPTGPAAQTASSLSPAAANRLNVNAKAFEFRPAANDFTPSGTSPSPQRLPSISAAPPAAAAVSFFDEKEKAAVAARRDSVSQTDENVIVYLQTGGITGLTDEQKKSLASTGGVPQPFRTAPTWTVPDERVNTSYEDLFPRPLINRSPLHTPGGHAQHLPHQASTPNQRYYNPQHHPYGQPFDPRAGGPGASVQSSPRFQQAQVPFSAQMPNMVHVPQFVGQAVPMFGMSPNMGQRALQMPQGTPAMLPQAYTHGPNTPMRQQYAQSGHFSMPQMGGQVMIPQGPAGYMNQQGYSPMPHHVQPHMQHMPQHSMQGGYGGSPRSGPHMMQHAGSHQGFQPHQMGMQYPAQPNAYAMNQRQMSAGQFPQATPRQQQAVPAVQPLPSPAAQGDEGK